MANDFFSIELGDNYLRVADADVASQKITINALGNHFNLFSVFNNQSDKTINETAEAIEKLIGQLKISKKNVNIIIPDSYSYSQIISMPKLKEKELLSAIKYQADQFIPLPLDEAVMDIDILYEEKSKKTLLILIVAAAQNLIDVISRVIEKAGLIPQNLENETSAICRLINLISKDQLKKQSSIFINFGYSSTSLYFYNPQLNLISNIYNFKSGLNLFSREVQVNFNLDQPKADEALRSIGMATNGSLDLLAVLRPVFNDFVDKVEKFIVSVKEKEKIEAINQLYLFNLANQINFFDKSLETRLGIKSNQFDLSSLINNNPSLTVYKQMPSSFISVIAGNNR